VRFIPSSPAPATPIFNSKPGSPLFGVNACDVPGVPSTKERAHFPMPTGTEPPTKLQTADPLEVWATLVELAQHAGLSPVDRLPARPNTTAHYPLYDSSDLPAVSSPLRADIWRLLLSNYPDRQYVDNIIGMINHGAKLGYIGKMRYLGRESMRDGIFRWTTESCSVYKKR